MKDRAGLALSVFLVSLGLGFAGDMLLRNTPWGINLPIWICLCAICGAGLVRKSPITFSRTALWMALPIGLFSLCFFWRDSDELRVANGTAIAVALGVLALRARKGSFAVASVGDYSLKVIGAWCMFVSDYVNLVGNDLNWREESRAARMCRAIARGALLGAPLLILFGALFVSGDAFFARSVRSAFTFDPASLAMDLILFSILALVVGGLFRKILLSDDRPSLRPIEARRVITLGTVEMCTMLGLLDVLFGLFVAVQFRYFFGGQGNVTGVSGLTYAEYARSGFFELAAAAGLTLPLVLGTHALVPADDRKAARLFAGFGAMLICYVLVVLTSAIERMKLYVEAYGLTEQRVFTTGFMVWLTLAFVWLAVTVLQNKKDRFAFGALFAGFAVIFGLNYINPDGMIARIDMRVPNRVDVDTLASLSLDAAPAISSRIGTLPSEQQRELKAQLQKNWQDQAGSSDWRSVTLSRLRYQATGHDWLKP